MPENLPGTVEVPVDLALVPLDDLRALETAAVAEFTALNEGEVSSTNVERALKLTSDLARVRDEIQVKETRAQQAAARETERLNEQMQTLATKVTGEPAAATAPAEGVTPVAVGISTDDIEKIVAAAAQGTAAVLTASDPRRYGTDLATRVSSSLADANRHVPDPQVPDTQLVVTASVDIPGVSQGAQLGFDDVVDAFHKRARNMSVTTTGNPDAGATVVTIRNQFENTIDDRTPLGQVEELFKYLTQPAKQEALLAGGGWCAPSEVRYNFFNVACEDGLIDLPTTGISRGGVRFPISPSMADVQLAPFVSGFGVTSNPWLWTETDDQATVTGSPNKPCVRVPCPGFDERRLECYGICLTAGNLTNDAYPEATANFLRLLMSAHSHAMNARIIQTMVGLSTTITTGGEFASGTANSMFNQILGGISLAAADYRARYGMCRDDVLEVVIPYWVEEALQADLAWRDTGGTQLLSATRQEIRSYFSARGVRAQFVNDWQVRGAGQFGNATAMTAWPATVDVMIYAAGTFILGNGLTLDLGVVRDSTLNAENDYTAAWSEECHLVAKVGHESRQYRITFNVGGANQGAVATGPSL